MKRRITAILIAIVLATTMNLGVFSTGTTEIHAIYKDPKIQIVVPSTGQMLINPGQFPVNVNGTVQSSQIVNTPWSLENYSEVAIKVDAVVTGEVADGSTIEFSSRSVNRRTRDKLIFLYLDMKVADPGMDLMRDLNWSETVYNSRKQMLITEDENERANIMLLAPAKLDGSLSKGGIGAFYLNGNVAPNPEDEWNPDKDKVNVKIAFTFRPTQMPST